MAALVKQEPPLCAFPVPRRQEFSAHFGDEEPVSEFSLPLPAVAVRVGEEWGSSGELLGVAGSPDSACPAFSKHQEEVGPFLKVEIPGAGLPSVPWIGQGKGGNRCQ